LLKDDGKVAPAPAKVKVVKASSSSKGKGRTDVEEEGFLVELEVEEVAQ
jgi:hypothetical protein